MRKIILLAVGLLTAGLLVGITTESASAHPACNGTLLYKRDYWGSAVFSRLPEANSVPPVVSFSMNTYYWYCNPFNQSGGNQVWPNEVGFCMTRENDARLAENVNIHDIDFDAFWQNLVGGGGVDPQEHHFLYPPDNGNRGDSWCTGRENVSSDKHWLNMNNDPRTLVNCNIDLRPFHPDQSCDFANASGGNSHELDPSTDINVSWPDN